MKIALIAPVMMLAVSCAAPAPDLSSLEMQQLQARNLETDKRTVFNASVSVLQDAGYVVKNADYETGLISASGTTINNTSFFDAITHRSVSTQTSASVFIEPWQSSQTRIRINFVEGKATSGQYGQSNQEDRPILIPEVYRNFFDQLDKAIFVRRGMNR